MTVNNVKILDDGRLQVTEDGAVSTPLSVEAVEALATQLPNAIAAAARADLTAAVRALTNVLLASGPNLTATLTITATTIVAVVDPDSFLLAEQSLGISPDASGGLLMGPLSIFPQP